MTAERRGLAPSIALIAKGPRTQVKHSRLVVVDPNVIDDVGHAFTASAAIVEAGVKLGIDVRVLVSRDFRSKLGWQFEPERTFVRLDGLWRLRRGKEPMDALVHAVQCIHTLADPNAVFYFPNLTPWFAAVWFSAVARLINAERRLIFMLRFSPNRSHTRVWRDALTASRRFSGVRFISDSRRLAEEYGRLAGVKVHAVPALCGTQPMLSRCEPEVPRLLYIGGGAQRQGLDILYDALEMLRDVFATGKLTATIVVSHHRELQRELEPIPGVCIWSRYVSQAEYRDLLNSASFIVIPYRNALYDGQSSGVLIEALSSGVPAVVTEDSWLSDNLPAGTGVTFRDGDAQSLAAAILSALSQISALQVNAASGAQAVRAQHGPEAYCARLLAMHAWNRARSESSESSAAAEE